MGKRADMEFEAIRLYADGREIPAISQELDISENSLRAWKKRAGNEWDEARRDARKDQLTAMEDVGSRLRRSREITAQLTGDVKDQGTMGLVLNQTIQTMLYDLLGQMQTAEVVDMSSSIDMMKGLALTLARTEQAAVLNQKREAEIRKLAIEQAADRAAHVAQAAGVTAETIQTIRRDVLMMAGQ
jgi:hypothetical protein